MTRERGAQAGIAVQFLALVRILSEYFRLKHAHGGQLSIPAIEPLIRSALLDAVLCFAAVLLFFSRRYRGVIIVAVGTIALLLGYKFHLIGWF